MSQSPAPSAPASVLAPASAAANPAPAATPVRKQIFDPSTPAGKILEESETLKKPSLFFDLDVSLNPNALFDQLTPAFGQALGKSRISVPHSVFKDIARDFSAARSNLRIVMSTLASAIEFNFSETHADLTNEFIDELKTCAKDAGASETDIARAEKTARDLMAPWSVFVKELTDIDQTEAELADFLKRAEPVLSQITMGKKSQGSGMELSIDDLRKHVKSSPETLRAYEAHENTDPNAPAQPAKPIPASDISRYRSMGEMVIKNDAAALKIAIERIRKTNSWDDAREHDINMLFLKAAETSTPEVLAVLLEEGKADILHMDPHFFGAMHYAAQGNKPDNCFFLKQKGLPVDDGRPDGHTPLMTAAENNAIDSLNKLVALGADINGESFSASRTAAHWAAENQHKEALEALVAHNIDLSKETVEGLLASELIEEENDKLYTYLEDAREAQTKKNAPAP